MPKKAYELCSCSKYKALHERGDCCPCDYATLRPLQEVNLLEKIIEPAIHRANNLLPNSRVIRDCDNVNSTTWNDWHLNLKGECPSCGYQNGDLSKESVDKPKFNIPDVKDICKCENPKEKHNRDCLFYGLSSDFKYSGHFNKEKSPVYENQKLTLLLAEIVKFTEEYRLVRNKEYMRLKVLEELGEYSVATLGDKVVTETPRQELVDLIITTFALFVLEGGNLEFFANYGMGKLEKAKEKINKLPPVKGESGKVRATDGNEVFWANPDTFRSTT